MKSTDAAAIASELVADSGHGSRQFARSRRGDGLGHAAALKLTGACVCPQKSPGGRAQQALSNDYLVARRWFDRGDNKEACGYYQKAMVRWRALETFYSDLNRETGDSAYSANSREMKGEQAKLLENNGVMCKEAGRGPY